MLDRSSIFRGGLLGKSGDLFPEEGGDEILDKKLNSGIFNDKKVYKQECFALS